MIIVGSATPTISKGCPPRIECMMPHIAVDANVSTVVSIPFVAVLSCAPKAMTGRAEAKKIYMVGANILKPEWTPATQSCLYQVALPLISVTTPLKGCLSRSIISFGAAAEASSRGGGGELAGKVDAAARLDRQCPRPPVLGDGAEP